MGFPPHLVEELRARLSVADVIGRRVQFDRKKSNPRKRDFWGCCPFHHEKTPSFHVDDSKGRYYCFGCHAKGDVVTFVMATENLTFPEAVEQLCREAGIEVPKATPQEAAAHARRTTLVDVLERASRFFQDMLVSNRGGEARAYLDKRGLSAESREAFAIGYAPSGSTLLQTLTGEGFALDLLMAAGLVRPGRDGRPPYDYFRNRVIFPITDPQNRTIGFGGRVLDPDVEPKYLNSPETDVFKKSRVLYNHPRARAAAREAGTLILAEGYMDVIALHAAGFGHAVAPLGTALTEDHLALTWRMVPVPILCFDGDEAGRRAAFRALDLALPHLTAERSLKFAILPAGKDPDDLVRSGGPAAMARILETAHGPADMIWLREAPRNPPEAPEERAALERRLDDAAKTMTDQGLSFHMRQSLRRRARNFFFQAAGRPVSNRGSRDRGRSRFAAPVRTGTPELTKSALALAPAADNNLAGEDLFTTSHSHSMAQERELLALVINHPGLLERHAETLAEIEFVDLGHDRLRRHLLTVFEGHGGLDRDALRRQLCFLGDKEDLASILDHDGIKVARSIHPNAPTEVAESAWNHIVTSHRTAVTVRKELMDSLTAYLHSSTPENEARLLAVKRHIADLMASGSDITEGPQADYA